MSQKSQNIEISGDDRLTLRRVVDAVPVSQKAICAASRTNESWLSKLLPQLIEGKPPENVKAKTTRDVPAKRLIRWLSGEIRLGRIELDKGTRDAFAEIEAGLFADAAGTHRIARYRPGEPVTAGSHNYVERAWWDDVLRRELQFAPDIRIALVGPPGMGKQSALAWMLADLRERGIRVAHFSGSQAISPGLEPSAKAVFGELVRVAIRQWDVDLPVPEAGALDDAGQCAEWLARASVSADPCVLVCDQMEKIGIEQALNITPEELARAAVSEGRSGPSVAYFAVLTVARSLARIRAQGGSVPGLIYCSERQAYPALAHLWDQSSGGQLNPIITSPLLAEHESNSLIEKLIEAGEAGSAVSAASTKEQRILIYRVFKGHPEFTHLAVEDWRRIFPDGPSENLDEEELKERCRRCFEQWYKRFNQTIATLAQVEARAAELGQQGKASDLLVENALADQKGARFPVCVWLKELREAAKRKGTS